MLTKSLECCSIKLHSPTTVLFLDFFADICREHDRENVDQVMGVAANDFVAFAAQLCEFCKSRALPPMQGASAA